MQDSVQRANGLGGAIGSKSYDFATRVFGAVHCFALGKRSAFRVADLENTKLVFMHHPKTGGTTLHDIFLGAFAKDEVCPERFNGLRHCTAAELTRYRYFSGHFDLPSLKLIPGKKIVITMLREPIDRLISLYNFERAHRPEVIRENNLELARLANAYTLEEFLLAAEVRAHPAINNSMTRALVDKLDAYRWEHRASVTLSDAEQYASLALHQLKSLHSFGIMERYSDSVALIFASLGLEPPQQIERKQVLDVVMETNPGLRRIDREPVTGRIRQLAAELVKADAYLYTRACRLFAKRLSAMQRCNTARRLLGHQSSSRSGPSPVIK